MGITTLTCLDQHSHGHLILQCAAIVFIQWFFDNIGYVLYWARCWTNNICMSRSWSKVVVSSHTLILVSTGLYYCMDSSNVLMSRASLTKSSFRSEGCWGCLEVVLLDTALPGQHWVKITMVCNIVVLVQCITPGNWKTIFGVLV